MLEAADTLEVAQRMALLASDMLSVRPDRCVCVRNRHSSCTRCSDACTSGAISIQEGRLVISSELCVGCGTCATVCPTCALEICHPNDAALLSAARESAVANEGKALFACHRAFESLREGAELLIDTSQSGANSDDAPDKAGDNGSLLKVSACSCFELVCLSRLEETVIASLFSQGVERIVALRGNCENCPRHDGIKSVRLVEETIAELKRVWKFENAFTVIELEGGENTTHPVEDSARPTPVSPEGGHDVSFEAQAHVMADGTLPHFVPARRAKLLEALASFGEPAEPQLDCRLWGHVVIDEELCRSCRMCTVFCPTGALCRYDDEDGSMGIEHYVAECVHCRLCEDICPAGAIVSSTKVPALQLAHGEVERYPMPEPEWKSGPDQIVRRMEKMISGNAVTASYSTDISKK